MVATASLAFLLTVCGAALATIYQVLPRLIRPIGQIIGTPGLDSLPAIGFNNAPFGSAFGFPGLPLFPNLPLGPNPNVPVDPALLPPPLPALPPNFFENLPIDALQEIVAGAPPGAAATAILRKILRKKINKYGNKNTSLGNKSMCTL
ncbi:hypothetical protein QYM36_000032 [Artemia franciscana]|uniref:Uncharacterized protein n=1 Tax=Artemia franciscana TaxID=6661 RepID=A0AA88IC73_ARTSF|nr:hypothetical protein QYM36_000032 [Artemia franciscana]